MPNASDVLWFKTQFGQQISSQLSSSPYTLDMATAIACQETGYIWQVLRKRLTSNAQILSLCVGDTIDGSGGRTAFPKTKTELLAKPKGAEMFAIARRALVDLANYIAGYKPSAEMPNKFIHGYGIFQYDLQHFLEDPDFFLDQKWNDLGAALTKLVEELDYARGQLGYKDKSSLSDLEMAFVAIAYNSGSCDPKRGLKQGFFSDGKYYGENFAEFLQLSQSVAFAPAIDVVADAASRVGFDSAAAATAAAISATVTNTTSVSQPPATPPVEMTAVPLAQPTEPIAIRALRIGAQGNLVLAWQSFLLGQHFDPGGLDGHFGDKTLAATKAFQTQNGLVADGIAGRQTLMRAMQLGFELIEEPADDTSGSNFPPRPNFPPLIDTAARQAIFGRYDYFSSPQPGNREAITIVGTWERDNIIDVPIPQLRRALGPDAPATIQFHRKAAAQLQGLWQAWESAELLDRVLSYDGSFAPRFIRGSSTVLSNHAFGTAFDINADLNPIGARPRLVGERGSVRELVPAANQWGFYWGGHFGSRPDGMHFEIAYIKT